MVGLPWLDTFCIKFPLVTSLTAPDTIFLVTQSTHRPALHILVSFVFWRWSRESSSLVSHYNYLCIKGWIQTREKRTKWDSKDLRTLPGFLLLSSFCRCPWGDKASLACSLACFLAWSDWAISFPRLFLSFLSFFLLRQNGKTRMVHSGRHPTCMRVNWENFSISCFFWSRHAPKSTICFLDLLDPQAHSKVDLRRRSWPHHKRYLNNNRLCHDRQNSITSTTAGKSFHIL